MDKDSDNLGTAHQIALRVIQDSLGILARWANSSLEHSPVVVDAKGTAAITCAKQLVVWPAQEVIGPLKVVFDAIHLEQGKAKDEQGKAKDNYWPAWAIANTENTRAPKKQYPQIPYPSNDAPTPEQIEDLRTQIGRVMEELTVTDWSNLSLLLLLLEKYGSYLSFGQSDIAFFDQVKATAAVAAALAEHPEATQLCLVSADLSGIQDFIYTISSDGALKSLRARSFTLELVTEEVVQQLLTQLKLPRTNVIYTGGGNLYLLAPAGEATHKTVQTLRYDANHWLLDQYQGKVFLSLTSHDFDRQDVGTQKLSQHWNTTIEKLAKQKSQKFDQHLDQLLSVKDTHEPCKVCHRDDTENLKPLDGDDGVEA